MALFPEWRVKRPVPGIEGGLVVLGGSSRALKLQQATDAITLAFAPHRGRAREEGAAGRPADPARGRPVSFARRVAVTSPSIRFASS